MDISSKSKTEIKRETLSDSSSVNQKTSDNVNETTRTVSRSSSSTEYSSQESEYYSPPRLVKPKKKKSKKTHSKANKMRRKRSDTPPTTSNSTAVPVTAKPAAEGSSAPNTEANSSFMQHSNHIISNDLRQKVSHLSLENVNLVKVKKEEIEMCYRQDCDTFSMVVRMLINKDPSLEPALQQSIKENFKFIGIKCIYELRDYIEHLGNASIDDIF